jgi:hypothetical protein
MDIKKRDVGIVTRFRTGRSGVRIPVGVRDFAFLQKVHTSHGANPAFYSIDARAPFRGLRGPSVKVPNPSIAEVQDEWNYTSNPPPSICLRG